MHYPVILAVDYGLKRVGLAISRATLADPLKTIPNDLSLISNIKQVIADERIEQLLVGVSENEMAELSQKFAEQLRQETQMPVELVDETLSSKSVLNKIKHDHLKHLKPGMPIDHFAAAEFLQEYLDFHS